MENMFQAEVCVTPEKETKYCLLSGKLKKY